MKERKERERLERVEREARELEIKQMVESAKMRVRV